MTRLIEENEAFKVLSAYYKHRTAVQDSALHDALSRVPSADLVNEWCDDCKEYDKVQHCCHRFTKVIRQAQEELKQNAVPVRHGNWIGYAGTIGNECSVCGKWIDVLQGTAEMNYCPNCGARMDEERKEE